MYVCIRENDTFTLNWIIVRTIIIEWEAGLLLIRSVRIIRARMVSVQVDLGVHLQQLKSYPRAQRMKHAESSLSTVSAISIIGEFSMQGSDCVAKFAGDMPGFTIC